MADQISKRKLSPDIISQTCDELDDFFVSSKAEKRDAIRIKFLIEETLLNYKDKFGEDVEFEIRKSSKLFKASLQLIVYCDKFNPFNFDEEGVMNSLMTASSQQNPSWQYVKSSFEWLFDDIGRNEIIFEVPKVDKTSNPVKMGIGLVSGVFLGTIARLLFSAENCMVFSNNYILPLANVYTGLLSVMAILLCFFSLPLTIVQYRNASQFQQSTKKIITLYAALTVFTVIVTTGLSLLVYGTNKVVTDPAEVIKSIFDVLISFFPNSLVTPFINFDCMQVMIIGLFFGFAFLAMGDQNKALVNLFDKTNLVAILTNNFFTKYVSVYVFFMTFYLALSSIFEELSKFLGFIITVIVVCAIAMLAFVAFVCLKFKVKYQVLLKKLFPAFVINLSSANIGASFMSAFSELSGDCGVEGGFVGIGYNLGTILYKPMYAMFLAASAFTAAHLSGVLSLKLAIQIMFLAMVLPATIPNISNGATSVIVVMLGQLGLGSQYADIMVSINALLQYVIVPVNVVCIQCAIICRAFKEDKLDINKLRS